MATAVEIEVGDAPERWAALGFALHDGAFAVGGVRVVAAGGAPGVHAVRFRGLGVEAPDGLPFEAARADPAPDGAPHPNGAVAVDHVVAFTDDRDRTAGALALAGGDVRRRAEPPELPAPMAFVRFGELIVEVAQAGGPPRFWGLTVTVADLDALAGPPLGPARPAVQRGRRIATVGRDAGLSVALAFMSRAQDSNPPAASG